MRLNSLKKTVYSVTLKESFEKDEDRLILSCILFSFVKSLLSLDNKNYSSSKELTESYFETFNGKLEELKEKYISYYLMRDRIKSFDKKSFLDFNLNEINQIYLLYTDKTEISKFSNNYYSQTMYKTAALNFSQNKRLEEIHYKIMIPIGEFYSKKYKINIDNLEVYSVHSVEDNPGKSIIFGIKDIPSSKILSDIENKIIGIEEYIYKSELFSNFVNIFIK